MKKLLIFTALLSALLLSSCQSADTDKNNTSQNNQTNEQTSISETASAPEETEETVADTGYLEIECNEPTGYKCQLFANSGEHFAFSIELPDDWTFEKSSEKAFTIKRNGKVIGKAESGDSKSNGSYSTVYNDEATVNTLLMQTEIEKNGSTGEYRYRLCFSKEGENRNSLTITADYSAISENTISKIRGTLRYKKIGLESSIHEIDIEKTRSNSVLIVGNSFVNSSRVGYILDEMVRKTGKNTYVEHISRGYAHVDTYSEDEYIMERIRSGEFGAIFVCGYYSNDQAKHLAKIKVACKESDTTLYMFPAHNEQATAIKYVQSKVTGVHLLDWKSEIQTFIDAGGNKWDFCINDMHLHSTPLAGYIGAHMIYRAIFGETPDCSVSEHVMQEQVEELLAGYSDSGIVYVTKGKDLNLFG